MNVFLMGAIQILYGLNVYGADNRNRTNDLLITNELLYQLSYVGEGIAQSL